MDRNGINFRIGRDYGTNTRGIVVPFALETRWPLLQLTLDDNLTLRRPYV